MTAVSARITVFDHNHNSRLIITITITDHKWTVALAARTTCCTSPFSSNLSTVQYSKSALRHRPVTHWLPNHSHYRLISTTALACAFVVKLCGS